ncbi:MAG: hypothetical protein K6T28_08640, partial [Acidothermus sp.]|nr:hypothetical protein [Acidothermus sp.]
MASFRCAEKTSRLLLQDRDDPLLRHSETAPQFEIGLETGEDGERGQGIQIAMIQSGQELSQLAVPVARLTLDQIPRS